MALTRTQSAAGGPVEAAGAVLWRPGPDGPELALIHRPRYDDWSFPKGKQDPGEHIQLTAVREVFEETGQHLVLGRRLPAISYELLGAGTTKRVRYWAAQALPDGDAGGRFEPNHEVDRLAWLTPEEALARLTRRLDAMVLGAFLAAPVDTVPIVLLRHGTAERRSQKYPDDRLRPLVAQGHAQAEALTELLSCFGRPRIVSSPAVRCVDTMRPFAGRQRTLIDIDPALSEAAHAAAPRAAASWIRALIAEGEPTVVCSHAEVLDDLLAAALFQAGLAQSMPIRAALEQVASKRAGQSQKTLPGAATRRRGVAAGHSDAPVVNGRPWSQREHDRLLGAGGGGGKLAPGRAWVLHVTRQLGPRRLPRLVAIDRLRP
ncbi:MAG TPA: NUDIX hydrolase [Actinocrinis sp.]|uniref:NUDIX hydrolase n=1 Tax=Actinocrinis sp. TaxID=1920516 RepID=UPI002DDC966D|nr:NUDIX hydrolase [Actinocrinis sp.]HEV2346594.1 NUDIX hydrolase [Actinocrinis sp.]